MRFRAFDRSRLVGWRLSPFLSIHCYQVEAFGAKLATTSALGIVPAPNVPSDRGAKQLAGEWNGPFQGQVSGRDSASPAETLLGHPTAVDNDVGPRDEGRLVGAKKRG